MTGSTAVARSGRQALPDVPADPSAGPYPLVLLSPGFAMGGATDAWLAEHLVSHGLVVIASEQDGEHLFTAMEDLWRSAVTRLQHLRMLLSRVDAHAESGRVLDGLVDTDRTAVVGHSHGGYGALAAAGARLDTTVFPARCATARKTADPSAWLCDAVQPHVADMTELADLRSVPSGLRPDWSLAGVHAVVSLAGDT